MIYPNFSMQEISNLTAALTVWYDYEIDVFASSKELIRTEDGFQVVANKTFNEFDIDSYECLIMPGILEPIPAMLDEKNTDFLKQFKNKNFIIASISSSPVLLAKAGLLDDKEYTLGLFQEVVEWLDYVSDENIKRKPVVRDKNIITAIGFASEEFAVETIRAIGIDCPDDLFDWNTKDYTEKELTFYMGEDNFKEFKKEFKKMKENQN